MKTQNVFLFTLFLCFIFIYGCSEEALVKHESLVNQNNQNLPVEEGPDIVKSKIPSSGNWELIFSDEFEGTEIDLSKWRNVYIDKGWSDGIHTFFNPDNMSVNGTSLVNKYTRDAPNTYSAGRVDTKGLFEVAYGYIECRMHVVYPNGYQTAFWMMPPNGTKPDGVMDGTANDGAEIDIVEARKQSESYATNLHWDGYASGHPSSHLDVSATGIHSNWMNVYGLEWTPTYMKFYYNGTVKRTITNPTQIPHVKEYIILSGSAFGGSWVDGDISTATLPDWAYYDYVRVYKNKEMNYGTGYFKLINKLSGKSLAVENWLTSDGAKIVQLPDNEYTNQIFQITHLSDGNYKLIAKHSNKCVGINAQGYLSQQTYSGTDGQKWKLEPVPNSNRVRLKCLSDSKYAEVENGSIDNNARIVNGNNPTWSRTHWEIIWTQN